MTSQRDKDHIVLSECGNYILRGVQNVGRIQVFEIKKNFAREIKVIDLKQVIAKHLRETGLEDSFYLNKIQISNLKWEEVVKTKKSSKFGVVVKAVSMVIIFHLEENTEPIIIQQSQADGISHFAWIPPIQEEKDEALQEGAYENSKQLLVFTGNCVQAKLFSLDCTQVLFLMDKPKRGNILVRPKLGNKMWSMVTHIRSLEGGEEWSAVYHFLNRGSISTNFYRFKIPESIADMESELYWSASGKWLSCFDCVGTLFGFLLQVFNSLGWYRNRNNGREMPEGDPIIDMGYLVDGISDHPQKNSIISVGANEYRLQWIQDQLSKAEFALVAGLQTTGESVCLEILVISIQYFGLIHKALLPEIPTIYVWQRSRTEYGSSKGAIRYNRSFKSSFRLNPNSKIRYFSSYNENGSWLAIHVDEILFVYEIIYGDDERLLSFNLIGTISLDSKVLALKFFTSSGETVKLLVALSSHAFVFDITRLSIEVIYKAFKLLKEAHIYEGPHFVRLVARAEAAPPSDWTVIDYTTAPVSQELAVPRGLISGQILSRDPLRGLGNTSKRTFDHRLGRVDISTFDELTDTFNIQKKVKR